MTTTTIPSIDMIRAQFPALATCPEVLFDNAGGSQVPRCVADAMRDYMLNTYVQLGADYETSRRSTDVVDRAHTFVRRFMNGDGLGEVILGSATTALCTMLADCYARALDPKRNEIIVAETGHEANVGPWSRLEKRGYVIKTWAMDPDTFECSLEDLSELLSERTRLVTFPHASNLLGQVVDARAIADAAHAVGAKVVVDGVAYAPHRAIDVRAIDADWYIYSTYKVYGPHMSALFGTHEALSELEGPNHFFIPRDEVPYVFELGGPSHEGCAGLLALGSYLSFLAGAEGPDPDRETIERAFDVVQHLEQPVQDRLLGWLGERDDCRIIGPREAGESRVPTISFTHATRTSRDIAVEANDAGLAVRFGHFYAHRLCTRLGLNDVEDGVVRTSGVHYTTVEDVERLIEFWERTL